MANDQAIARPQKVKKLLELHERRYQRKDKALQELVIRCVPRATGSAPRGEADGTSVSRVEARKMLPVPLLRRRPEALQKALRGARPVVFLASAAKCPPPDLLVGDSQRLPKRVCTATCLEPIRGTGDLLLYKRRH